LNAAKMSGRKVNINQGIRQVVCCPNRVWRVANGAADNRKGRKLRLKVPEGRWGKTPTSRPVRRKRPETAA